MEGSAMVKVTAIVCLSVIEVVNALVWKVDGTIMGLIIAAISGLAGYEVGRRVGGKR